MIAFSLGGCRLEFKFSCFALLAFFCLFAGAPGGASFLLAAALHESAHLATLFAFRAPPRSVRFSALGCRMLLDPEKPLGYRRQTAVSLAGPLANWISFALLAVLGFSECPFALASFALGLLHSLPAEPFDGGLALRAFLSGHMDGKKAERILFLLSLVLLLPLFILGFWVLLQTRWNYSLLALSLYLLFYLLSKRDALDG